MSLTPPANTREVSERHRLNEESLSTWWISTFGTTPAPLTIRKFKGGESNPTYWIADGERQSVLRKKPPGKLLPSAHAIEREYKVLRALRDTDVPVTPVRALCEDSSVIGTPFYVMEYVSGRTFWNVQLPDSHREERRAIYQELVRVLAAIHNVDIDAIGLSDYGKRSGYLTRQIERWTEQYRRAETETIATMDRLIEWLPANTPSESRLSLAHGDYRLDNLIFHPEEPRALAVIDWELSTLGDPLADLAYTCMLYDIALPRVGGLLGVDFEKSGIPDEESFIRTYSELTGTQNLEAWPFYKAFSLFRLAAIAQGVYRRSIDGNASSDQGAMFGAAVHHLASVAVSFL